MEALPSYERESRWAIVALLLLVVLMGAGAFAFVLSGYSLI